MTPAAAAEVKVGGRPLALEPLKRQKIDVRALIKRNEQNEMRAAQAIDHAPTIVAAQ